MADHNWTLEQLLELEGKALKSALGEILWSGEIDLFNTYRQISEMNPLDLSGLILYGCELRTSILKNCNLSKADLRSADLSRSDLRTTNLSGAYLRYANLGGSNLSEVNMRGAYLPETNLRWSTLCNTDLSQADLRQAELFGANLRNANLRAASIYEANLANAELVETDFEDVRMGGVILANVNLSNTRNLHTVHHHEPSTIGIDTLYRSKGNIPEVFLRGCGVPDTMIEFARSLVLAERPIDFYSCFISYSHADKEFARQLHDRLQGEGIRCWLDEKHMVPGDDIYEEVQHGIRYWDKVLLCCSEASLNSWWCDNEMDTAFTKEREFFKERKGGRQIKALIPLDLDGYLFSPEYKSGKKEKLHSRLAADFRGWRNDNDIFVRGVEGVIRALQTDGGKEEPPPPKL